MVFNATSNNISVILWRRHLRFMVFNATCNNISVILWAVLLKICTVRSIRGLKVHVMTIIISSIFFISYSQRTSCFNNVRNIRHQGSYICHSKVCIAIEVIRAEGRRGTFELVLHTILFMYNLMNEKLPLK